MAAISLASLRVNAVFLWFLTVSTLTNESFDKLSRISRVVKTHFPNLNESNTVEIVPCHGFSQFPAEHEARTLDALKDVTRDRRRYLAR